MDALMATIFVVLQSLTQSVILSLQTSQAELALAQYDTPVSKYKPFFIFNLSLIIRSLSILSHIFVHIFQNIYSCHPMYMLFTSKLYPPHSHPFIILKEENY